MPTPHGGFLGTLESFVVRLRLRRNEHYRMGFRLYKLARRADKERFCVLAGTLLQHAAGFILTALGDETDNAPHEPRRDSGVALDGVVGLPEDDR